MTDARIDEIKALLPRGLLSDWVRLGTRLGRLVRDARHSGSHDAVLNRLLDQARASVALCEQRRVNLPRPSYPSELPITARKDEIVTAIRSHQVVIISGETGSGKTTQLPKMCLEAGLGIEARIGCTQPRRVAALSISRRIAEELKLGLGREIGCKIRFDDRSGPLTYIKLMTDGILLAETQGDPLLTEYNAIIIDEAHERSLNIDFLLGYLKGLLAQRTDLKLIITSATIDTEAFSRAFNDAPIIEVSGRLYPVEVAYAPFDAASEENGDVTYIDAAVRAAEQVFCEPGCGDVLIFMPGERDIRETSDALEGRFGREANIIPLFGRLSSGEQQRVFAPSAVRKIVIATNIAETSLTIPGIRYVIDSGLARMSRYNPRTRTRRLPVEPISQSSANQRKGRCGRVQNGLCIRLFSEEDFAGRPLYTQPEIQRANLAEVILRMKAFRLGEIESFPFVNPPPPAAIQGGYALLQELGALSDARELTPLGRSLARLPIDPTLGRMLLQSQHEHATRELLIIAAGLSIQDPRERPLEQRQAAAAAHRRFEYPDSDFLTLLNIWNAVHEQWEKLRTQNQRRKFCKTHFLSYLRMREWQELHAQLHEALEELGAPGLNESNAAPAAVHRSILSGLLGHVASRADRNLYKAAGNRQVNIFPGSALHERADPTRKGQPPRGKSPSPKPATRQPAWIMAGEIVETSQLFARTVAGIDPAWIVQLAPHLCQVTHQNPHWSVTSGRVLAEEKVTLYGLDVRWRKVSYGNIDPKAATEIFIRSALVEENLWPDPPSSRRADEELRPEAVGEVPATYAFLEHNRRIRQQIETWQTRIRRYDLADPEQALFNFYAKLLVNISSLHELNRFLREPGAPARLCATETELTGGQDLGYDAEAFPNSVPLGGQPVPLSYAYAPGEEQDGVTVKLGFSLAQSISPASVEWAVPGLREGQILELLQALPKALRRQLMPFPPKVAEIAHLLAPTGQSLRHDLSRFIHRHYGVEIPLSAWPADALPRHLQPRIEVVGPDHKPLGAGRDLVQLRRQLEQQKATPQADSLDWIQFSEKWERFGLTGWTVGDLPQRLVVSEGGAIPLYAWPGLQNEEGTVNLRLFRTEHEARRVSFGGIQRLVELAMEKDLGWLQKDLRTLASYKDLMLAGETMDELQADAFENLRQHLLPRCPFPELTEAHFKAAVAQARDRLPGLATKMSDRLAPILKLRHALTGQRLAASPVPPTQRLSDLKLLAAPSPPLPATDPWAGQLEELVPRHFLASVPFARLAHLPRYLKALLIRAERARLNPAKDRERARQLAPYLEALRHLRAGATETDEAREALEEFRWMLEEFKVSLFAQELGTDVPVSAKRLDQQLARLRHG